MVETPENVLPRIWMLPLLLWALTGGVAGAQELVQSPPSAETILLGQEVRWRIQILGSSRRPQLATLPSCTPHDLRIVEEEIAQDEGGLWDGRWIAAFRPASAGKVHVPALTVLLGKRDLQGESFVLDVTRDKVGERVSFLSWEIESRSLWLGESVDVTLTLGVEETFLRDQVVQPFRRPLDLPVQIEPLQSLTGLTLKAVRKPTGETGRSLVYRGRREVWRTVGDVVKDGKTFTVVQRSFSLTCDQEGEHLLHGPLGRLRFATAWKEDFVGGRVPEEIREAFVHGGDVALTVKPLPLEGRPPSWQGALGEWQLDARVRGAPREVGDTFQLIVDVKGKGPDIPAPLLAPAAGLRVVGAARLFDEKPGRFRFDLMALSAGVLDLPSVTVSSFLPRRGIYRRFAAPALQVKVPEAAVARSSGENLGPASWDVDWQDAPRFFVRPGDVPERAWGRLEERGLAWLVTLLPWGGALVWGRWLQQKKWRLEHPLQWRAKRAFKDYRSARRGGRRSSGDALLAYVAARLHCREAVLYSPEWQETVAQLGLEADLEGELKEVLTHLVHARYRGRPDGLNEDVVDALVARMESSRRRTNP